MGTHQLLIKVGAFANTGLTSLTIPATVTRNGVELELMVVLESGSFDSNASLSTISIAESVGEILGGVFSNCANLSSVTTASTVVYNSDCWPANNNITVTIIPAATSTEIVANFMKDNTGVTTVYISYDITVIQSDAFKGCTNLGVLFWGSAGT